MKIFLIVVGIFIAILLAILIVLIWGLQKGIDQKYKDVDTNIHLKDGTPS